MVERGWRTLIRRRPASAGEAQAAECLQCGSDRIDIVATVRGRLRVSCRACGAVTLQDVSRLRSRATSDAAPAPVAERERERHQLAPYVSEQLLTWAIETGRDRRAGSLDKGAIYRLWKEFDRSDAGRPQLPAFGSIVGLLHASSYDEALVVAELADEADAARRAAVAERVGCARRWLAGPGRAHCWIERRAAPAAIEAIDVDALRSLLAEGVFDEALTPAQREALFLAAFGAGGGPTIAALLRCFDAQSIADAIRTHLRDGSHPLRGRVLAALDGGDERDRRDAATPTQALPAC